REDPGVVSRAMDGPRIGRDAVLDEALRGLPDGAGEEDAGQRRALPPRREDGEPRAAADRAADVRQVEEWRHEARRGDHVIDVDGQLVAVVGPAEMHGQAAIAALRPLDAVERRVEHRDATAEHEVLIRLDVPGPNTGQG